jgi:L-rhamnose mutarotase
MKVYPLPIITKFNDKPPLMVTLRIEHKIASYEGWKRSFDSDPINRKKSGVKRYRIYQPADNPNFVIIELDFDNMNEAFATKDALQRMWTKVEGTVIFAPQTSLLYVVEEREL